MFMIRIWPSDKSKSPVDISLIWLLTSIVFNYGKSTGKIFFKRTRTSLQSSGVYSFYAFYCVAFAFPDYISHTQGASRDIDFDICVPGNCPSTFCCVPDGACGSRRFCLTLTCWLCCGVHFDRWHSSSTSVSLSVEYVGKSFHNDGR